MYKGIITVAIFMMLLALTACSFSGPSDKLQSKAKSEKCVVIENIIHQRVINASNAYLTNNLSMLTNESNLVDHASKGFIGITYDADSVFWLDMKAFASYYNCGLNIDSIRIEYVKQ